MGYKGGVIIFFGVSKIQFHVSTSSPHDAYANLIQKYLNPAIQKLVCSQASVDPNADLTNNNTNIFQS